MHVSYFGAFLLNVSVPLLYVLGFLLNSCSSATNWCALNFGGLRKAPDMRCLCERSLKHCNVKLRAEIDA